jgi:hypothetical protein
MEKTEEKPESIAQVCIRELRRKLTDYSDSCALLGVKENESLTAAIERLLQIFRRREIVEAMVASEPALWDLVLKEYE